MTLSTLAVAAPATLMTRSVKLGGMRPDSCKLLARRATTPVHAASHAFAVGFGVKCSSAGLSIDTLQDAHQYSIPCLLLLGT